jgi:putative SOS response-associated peptidase YedK
MCYSAMVWEDYRKYCRTFGATLSIHEFVRLVDERLRDSKIKLPKAMTDAFADPQSDAERGIAAMIAEFNREQASATEQDIFRQKKRLADAERSLQTKVTKKAENDRRIATDKISKGLLKLDDLRRTAPKDRDSRIFPGVYAPVLVVEDGQRVVKPMRYQCRPAGKPALYDTKYPGTYNARRDNLEGFWKGQFGVSHGIMVAQRFYENVERVDEDGKPFNVVLEFNPADGGDMLVACLWSRWTDPAGLEPDLLSFAAITDDPPPEVAAAGHDRCIVPIKPENVDAWLNPQGRPLADLYAILDDRHRPYYEHRLAA